MRQIEGLGLLAKRQYTDPESYQWARQDLDRTRAFYCSPKGPHKTKCCPHSCENDKKTDSIGRGLRGIVEDLPDGACIVVNDSVAKIAYPPKCTCGHERRWHSMVHCGGFCPDNQKCSCVGYKRT